MLLAEKPPLIEPPPIPDRGDNNHLRFVMTVPADVRETPLLHAAVPAEEYSDYEGCNISESLRRVWKRRGLTLLGLQISHLTCDCGDNCPGSMWGLVMPKDNRHMFTMIKYALLAGAVSLEQVDDPSIKEGLFTVEYRGEI